MTAMVGAGLVAVLVVAGSRLVEMGVEEGVTSLAEIGQDASPLLINHYYPDAPWDCGGSDLAMPVGGPGPESFSLTQERPGDSRTALLQEGGGAFRNGTLVLDLTAKGNESVYIQGVDVEVFDKGGPPASWAWIHEAGCGESTMRWFFLDLDETVPHLVDQGVLGGDGASQAEVRADPFGSTFSVTSETPARVAISATACEQSVRWGLRVRYIADGQEGSLEVGSPTDPLINLVGMAPAYVDGIVRGTFNGSLQQDGETREFCYKPDSA